MDEYIAIIKIFAGTFNPIGTMFCQGQILSIQTNQALFALVGTMYGGNGTTTFALPNIGGRVPVGTGQAPGISRNYQLGEVAGIENITLTSNQMPMHVHTQALTSASTSSQAGTAIAAAGDAITPLNNYLALSPKIGSGPNATQLKTYATAAAGAPVSLGGGAITTNTTTSGNTAIAGGSQPVSIMQPYLAINYVITTQGIFPSRN